MRRYEIWIDHEDSNWWEEESKDESTDTVAVTLSHPASADKSFSEIMQNSFICTDVSVISWQDDYYYYLIIYWRASRLLIGLGGWLVAVSKRTQFDTEHKQAKRCCPVDYCEASHTAVTCPRHSANIHMYGLWNQNSPQCQIGIKSQPFDSFQGLPPSLLDEQVEESAQWSCCLKWCNFKCGNYTTHAVVVWSQYKVLPIEFNHIQNILKNTRSYCAQ